MRTGNAIRDIRKLRGMRQKELASATMLSQTFISLVEKGKKEPSPTSLRAIARILECPIPVIHWMALEERDVPMKKRKVYYKIKDKVDELLKMLM